MQNVRTVELLLAKAEAPRTMSDAAVAKRISVIVSKIKGAGGRVTKADLGKIVAEAGMAPTSVGTLYFNGYVKQHPRDKRLVVLGPKGKKG